MQHKGSHGEPKIATRTTVFDTEKMTITVMIRIHKISRKRLVGLVMYYGVPARIARKMADVVRDNGLSYENGFFAVMSFLEKKMSEEQAEHSKMVNGCAETSEALR